MSGQPVSGGPELSMAQISLSVAEHSERDPVQNLIRWYALCEQCQRYRLSNVSTLD